LLLKIFEMESIRCSLVSVIFAPLFDIQNTAVRLTIKQIQLVT
jgi:hypothetical protein